MFGPKLTTSLDAAEYRLILSALEREAFRLRADVERHRDAYDPPAWAEATSKGHLVRTLVNRLEYELGRLPVATQEERQWQADHLQRWAGRIPRSKANATAHHADVVKRRNAEEARKAAYWEGRGGRGPACDPQVSKGRSPRTVAS
jgi:hypothetical protein